MCTILTYIFTNVMDKDGILNLIYAKLYKYTFQQ